MRPERPEASVQQRFWNQWNAEMREDGVGFVSRREADVVRAWLDRLGRTDLDIVEVGCGAGWFSGELREYGRVTAIDLADEVLARARVRLPGVRFIAGDFMAVELPDASADVVVALQVLSHVADQAAFLARIRRLLRRRGHLMLATQNRFVLERRDVAPLGEGQLRKWLSARELRGLLEAEFATVQIASVTPDGYRGVLRIVNSPKLNRIAATVVPQKRLDRSKERLGLGHSLMALAYDSGPG